MANWMSCPWKMKPLSEFVTKQSAGISIGPADFAEAGMPVIHKGDIQSGGDIDLDGRKNRFVKESFAEENKRAIINSEFLVVSLRDLVPSAPQLGLVSKLENGTKALLAQGTYGFKINSKIFDPNFLIYLSNSVPYRRLIKKKAVGSTQVHLRSSEFFDLNFPVPPMSEQIKISAILQTWDESIKKLELLIEKEEIVFSELINKLCETSVPKTAKLVKLGEIGEFKNGLNKSKDDFGHGKPFVNLLDIFGRKELVNASGLGLVNASSDDQSNYDLKAGDVLFVRSSVKPSGVGLTTLISKNLREVTFSGFIIRFRESSDLFYTRYKKYCFHAKQFRKDILRKSKVGANTNINQDSLQSLSVKIPPIEHQKSAVQILDFQEMKIAKLEALKENLLAQKKYIMHKLLSGESRVVS